MIFYSAVYGLFFCCLLLVVAGYHASPGTGIGEKILEIREGIGMVWQQPMVMVNKLDVLIAAVGTGILFLAIQINHENQKKFRKGEEYGSARWGTRKDIIPFMDQDPFQNVILTKTEGLTMNSRPKVAKYARNKNVLIIGGSGSGKTRFYVTPNIMQLHSSYVITDPKGSFHIACPFHEPYCRGSSVCTVSRQLRHSFPGSSGKQAGLITVVRGIWSYLICVVIVTVFPAGFPGIAAWLLSLM